MQNFNSKYKSSIQERSKALAIAIIRTTEALPRTSASSIIAHQIIRSAASIGANLIEGRAASSRLEFKKFYEISLKSANETKYWLDLLSASQPQVAAAVAPLKNETREIANMLAAGVIKLKQKL